MGNWYTADPHFNHSAIIKFCDRPFKDVAQMDQALLHNLESCVTWDDDLYILGDFSFGGESSRSYLQSCFDRIPDRKHLIVGNHDTKATFSLGWTSVQTLVEITDGDQKLVLCHYPMITFKDARRGALQLFGHVHKNWQGSHNTVNVGVDVWNFLPIQVAEIQRRARTLPVNKHWRDVEPDRRRSEE